MNGWLTCRNSIFPVPDVVPEAKPVSSSTPLDRLTLLIALARLISVTMLLLLIDGKYSISIDLVLSCQFNRTEIGNVIFPNHGIGLKLPS